MSLGRSNSTGVLAAGKRRPRPLKIGGSRLSAIELSSVEDVIGNLFICKHNEFYILNKTLFVISHCFYCFELKITFQR